MGKLTPLYETHLKLNGNMVDFAGYTLPVQYAKGIITEHNAVRQNAGLFDVSHMGEFRVSGKDAQMWLNSLLTNDIRGMYDGQVRYSLLPNEKGGAIDDILIYRFNENDFFIVVNASNTEKDANWMMKNLSGDVKFENISDSTAQIALQGPKSLEVLAKLTDTEKLPQKYYSFKDGLIVAGTKCLVSRTGYTGEDGYELYCNNEDVVALYDELLKAGQEFEIEPCGLGARDTLRLEAAMPLYGHELNEDIMVNEVGLDFAIKLQKENFVGKGSILSHEPKYARIGAEVVGRGIAREHSEVYSGEKHIGYVTSGTFSPTLQKAICMLRVKKEFINSPLTVDVRGKRLELKTVTIPFYKRVK